MHEIKPLIVCVGGVMNMIFILWEHMEVDTLRNAKGVRGIFKTLY